MKYWYTWKTLNALTPHEKTWHTPNFNKHILWAGANVWYIVPIEQFTLKNQTPFVLGNKSAHLKTVIWSQYIHVKHACTRSRLIVNVCIM